MLKSEVFLLQQLQYFILLWGNDKKKLLIEESADVIYQRLPKQHFSTSIEFWSVANLPFMEDGYTGVIQARLIITGWPAERLQNNENQMCINVNQ